MTPSQDITEQLVAWSKGDKAALDDVLPLVYNELRRLARHSLLRERDGHTLQPTALVHEAYLRLTGQREVDWHNRAQFIGVAAQIMRRILSQYAVRRSAMKRSVPPVTLPLEAASTSPVDLLIINRALDKLTMLDEQQSRIVEMRYFGGLSIEETATVLGSSPATVKREWTLARAWLLRELSGAGE
jgi:RNA polymerase sigma factor (TIGR02999 family)